MNLAMEFDFDEVIQEKIKEEGRKDLPKIVVVKADFSENNEINFTHNATGETSKVNIINDKIHLMMNRTYHIPVNTKLCSDDYKTIKIPSEIADKIDVRFVKGGFVNIIVIQHNTIIKNDDKICIMNL